MNYMAIRDELEKELKKEKQKMKKKKKDFEESNQIDFTKKNIEEKNI